MSPFLTRAFAGACVLAGKVAEAAAILMAFDGLLRPGEMYLVEMRDLTFYPTKAVLTLRDTKTGKRKGTGEMAVINSLLANKWLRLACKNKSPRDLLLLDGTPAFRLLFKNLVSHSELKGLYAIYSLRRGGATWDFLLHQSMERTLLRGRWTSSSTASIYLQDTVATVANLSLTPLHKAHAPHGRGCTGPALKNLRRCQCGVRGRGHFFFALDIAITWLVPRSVIAERWSQQSQWLLVCTTSVSERKPVKSMDAKKAL